MAAIADLDGLPEQTRLDEFRPRMAEAAVKATNGLRGEGGTSGRPRCRPSAAG